MSVSSSPRPWICTNINHIFFISCTWTHYSFTWKDVRFTWTLLVPLVVVWHLDLTTCGFFFPFLSVFFLLQGMMASWCLWTNAKGWLSPKMHDVDWSVVMETDPLFFTKISPGSTFSLPKKNKTCSLWTQLHGAILCLCVSRLSVWCSSLWSTFFFIFFFFFSLFVCVCFFFLGL